MSFETALVPYREMEGINQSRLKEILKHPKRYLDYTEGQKEDYFTFGQLVEDLCFLTEEEIEALYIVSEGSDISDNLKLMVEFVYKNTGAADLASAPDDVVYAAATEINYQPKWKRETVINKIRTEGKDYYDLIKKATNKTIITPKIYADAYDCYFKLTSGETAKYFTKEKGRYENIFKSHGQFNYKGYMMKSEIDIFHIDHETKTCRVVDLKTTSFITSFDRAIVKFRYDFQTSFYTIAAINLGLVLEGYKVDHPLIVAVDSNAEYNPEVHLVPYSTRDFKTKSGLEYQGIDSAMKRLDFHTKEDNWDHSMEYIQKGMHFWAP
jgi:hypothetical protein